MKFSQILSLALVAFTLAACNNAAKETTNNPTANANSEKAVKAVNTNVENASTTSAPAENAKLAAFKFDMAEHDFGDINQGDKVEKVFKFTNVGEVPLVISDIGVTCGCTTPSYTKEPVAPGAEGEILVKFNSAGKRGNQIKPVTIKANVEGGQSVIRIKTNVLTNEQQPAAGPLKQ